MEEKNRTPTDNINKLDLLLDEYEEKNGLPKYVERKTTDDNIKKYLSISREEMEAMSIEDCANAALMLSGFSFYLQRTVNRESARVNWADNMLKKLIAGKENNFRGSWDSQFQQAVNNDDYAKQLLKLKQYAQSRMDRLSYLSTSIKNMGDLFVNLQKAKAIKGLHNE